VAVNIDDVLKLLTRVQETTTDGQAKERLMQALKDLRQYLQDQETERAKLNDTLEQQKSTIGQLQTSIAGLKETNNQQASLIDELKKKLDSTVPASSDTPLNIASSFKGVIDAIQKEARATPGVATTVKSLDIEVKGLVQIQPGKGTTLVLPTAGAAIDPQSLSTLRISFGAIPVAAAATPTPPTPSPPTPAHRPISGCVIEAG
jgi:ABC-type transporter Mla subunit MlaD